MKISNILIFDDRDWIIDIAEKIPGCIRSGMKDTTKKKNRWYRIPFIENDNEIRTTVYYQKSYKKLYKRQNGDCEEFDWSDDERLSDILSSAAAGGCLILCDYSWDKYQDQNFPEKLVNTLKSIKDASNVLFILYTTFDSPSAQRWLDKQCDIKSEFQLAKMLLELREGDENIALEMVKEYFARHEGVKE